jgi:predicted transcriptional regulator
MSKQKITIKIDDLKNAAKEFIDVWHRVEKGNVSKVVPVEKISFNDQRLLFKTLTPRRWELLHYVHEKDKVTIRALAKALDRDYSNVHQDVKILNQLGLILKDEQDGKYYVPWDVIVTELSLATKSHSSRQDSSYKKPHGVKVAHG